MEGLFHISDLSMRTATSSRSFILAQACFWIILTWRHFAFHLLGGEERDPCFLMGISSRRVAGGRIRDL